MTKVKVYTGLPFLFETHAETMTATSALDAESETLVNSALAALLKGNNTTISIAHRLSTIKRSDQIIVLSNDGTVAEQGTYEELSSDPNGAFTKLMEWQLSGGELSSTPKKPLSSQPPAKGGDLAEGYDNATLGHETRDRQE